MKHFSDPEQTEIKTRLSIEGVLKHYNVEAEAKEIGDQAVRRCPMHDDRQPSFSYNTRKQVWKCHSSCGGGDVFSLIQAFEDCPFPDAVRKGAEISGFSSPERPIDPFVPIRRQYLKQVRNVIEAGISALFQEACSNADVAALEGDGAAVASAQVIARDCHGLLDTGNLREKTAYLLESKGVNIEFLLETETEEEVIDGLSVALDPSTFEAALGVVQQRLELSRHSSTVFAPTPTLDAEFEAKKAEALRMAQLLYRGELLLNADSKRARQYLSDRGISQETCEEFGVGYAPPGGNWFAAFCEGRGLVDAAIAVGLLKDCPVRGLVDLYVDRLMLPFLVGRNATGFTGRAMQEDQLPKYKHTAGSKAGQPPYGWQQEQHAALNKTALLVEGQFDVLAVNSAELPAAYALSGTSISDAQARILRMRCQQVLVALDGDEAGQKATEKVMAKCREWGLKASSLRIKNGMDVADVIQAGGGRSLLEALESRLYD